MVPSDAASLSLLVLKLLRKERSEPYRRLQFGRGARTIRGLERAPEKSFATDYSYRTQRQHQEKLLGSWVKRLSPIVLPEAKAFSLDFHPIPYRGEDAVLENHYIPCRGQACPSVQAFFAQEHEQHVFCYANANLIRDEQTEEVIRFVDYWQDLTGRNPEWLYFDSKLTTYAELSELEFAHRCTSSRFVAEVLGILKRLDQRPQSDWIPATIDIPKRRQKRIRYLDENIRLDDYDGTIRQIAVTGLGREQPTLFVTNHPECVTTRDQHELRPTQRHRRWFGNQRQLLSHGQLVE